MPASNGFLYSHSSLAATQTLHLPHPLRQLVFPKLQQIHDTLFAKVDPLDIGYILRRRPADPARHDDRVNLKYDSIIDNLINGKGDEVVALYQGTLVGRISVTARLELSCWPAMGSK